MGWGSGLRLDFEYFVIRLDVGLLCMTPDMNKESAGVSEPINGAIVPGDNNLVFNLAIGYPF